MRLQKIKINKYTVSFLLLIFFIFMEVLIMSPRLLEKKESEDSAENLNVPERSKSETVEQKMQGVHLVENSESEKGWELFANEAVGTADSQWVLKKVKVQFFNENKSNFLVTGDLGRIDGTSKDMNITGNVKIVSSNGYNFTTKQLNYIAKQKTMVSDDEVLMEGPDDRSGKGFKLTGQKLLVDVVKNKMSILEKIHATKIINLKKFDLTSTRADFSNKSQEAQFSGNVKMDLGGLFVQAPIANFQYSNVNKALNKIVLQQGVEFVDKDRKGSCTDLEMDLVENKMTMRGQPKVQQGEDEIKGHEIVFFDGGKKVKINRAKNKLKK